MKQSRESIINEIAAINRQMNVLNARRAELLFFGIGYLALLVLFITLKPKR